MTRREVPRCPLRAASYTRTASDPTGQRAEVSRQRANCRALAQSQGWIVVGTYEDDNAPAVIGGQRPGYARLCEVTEAGEVGVWVA